MDLDLFSMNPILVQSSVKRSRSPSPEQIVIPFEMPPQFECQRRTPLDHLNIELIKQFQQIQRHRYLTGESRSELSYARAIATLKACPIDLKSDPNAQKWAKKLPCIGPKIASMIEEYLEACKSFPTYTISEVLGCWGSNVSTLTPLQSRTRALDELTKVFGVGPARAARLHDKQGIKSIEDLKKRLKLSDGGNLGLTKAEMIGIHFYDDFQHSLSREQVRMISDRIESILLKLDHTAKLEIVGGYRRGKKDNGDVDVLIYFPADEDAKSGNLFRGGLLKRLINEIDQQGYLVATLSQAYHCPNQNELDLSLLVLKGLDGTSICRRVDLIACTYSRQNAFALLGWTGYPKQISNQLILTCSSKMFERSIRRWAEQRCGFRLSSTEITFLKDGECPNSKISTEKDIFTLLGLEYIDPEYRNA